MLIPLAILLAVASAVFYAISAVLQEREASRQSATGLGLMARLVRRRVWWAAVGATLAGATLHVAALGAGPLVVVQPIGVSCLAIALVLGSRVNRTRISPRSWAGVLCVALGLPAVLAAVPHHGPHGAPPAAGAGLGFWPVVGVLAAVVVVAAGTGLLCGRRLPRGAAVCYSVGAALCFGLASATAKTMLIGHLTPERVALTAAAALVGTALAQHAYRGGGLGAPLAVLTLLDPLTAGAMGVLVLGEPFGRSPLTLALGVLGLLVTAVGVGLLSARRPAVTAEPPAPEPVGAASRG
ncbi:DMT family transporter [Pseudonocardia sp. RS11V-5]|uniref:DMT family transporter n=1 Tax=Pseudonocardia terrae TaxID=2905831 RepID=UPI001E56561F|nr:DMT family transporter [Pseudonocardia terrae]MCE3553090.1 DMT family transporter [Pseudonocardia terrae]